MTTYCKVPVGETRCYKPFRIYKVEATYIEAGKKTPYVAMFEAIPHVEGVVAMVKHASDSMFDAAKGLDPAGRDAVNDLRAQAATYARLAALIHLRAVWPESAYKTGYALLSLANAADRELGELVLSTTHYWGLRNA